MTSAGCGRIWGWRRSGILSSSPSMKKFFQAHCMISLNPASFIYDLLFTVIHSNILHAVIGATSIDKRFLLALLSIV